MRGDGGVDGFVMIDLGLLDLSDFLFPLQDLKSQ
jgi:hypothetical protein